MRDWRKEGLENFGIFEPFDTVGKYEIPVIRPVYELPDLKWTGFNYARGMSGIPPDVGVHFFLDDYQFNSVWLKPRKYLDMLGKFGAVMSPDFSTYSDMPIALQMYNHYRKHWLAQFWQFYGITVIPTISWSTPESYEWCFDGEPQGSVVAVSSIGTQDNKVSAELFRRGYREMTERLKPSVILCYGKAFDFMEGNIVGIEPFVKRFSSTVPKNACII